MQDRAFDEQRAVRMLSAHLHLEGDQISVFELDLGI
jgi:hypothetical protein